MSLSLAAVTANSLCDVINAQCSNGYIRIYGTNHTTLLAELRFGNPAFQNPVNGSMVQNPITSDTQADNSGTATIFKVFKSDGTTEVLKGLCGTAANPKQMNFDTLTITKDQTVTINSFVFSCPNVYTP